MTTRTLPQQHLPGRKIGLGVAGVALAAAAGYAAFTWATEDPVPVAPANDVSNGVTTDGSPNSRGSTDQQARKLHQLR